MIKINLLYRSVAEKEKKTNIVRQVAIGIAVVAVLALIITGIQLFMMHSISNLEKEIKAREDRLVVLKKLLGEIDDIRSEKKILEKKLAVINKLDEDRLYPVRLLDEINKLIIQREIQLTKVTELGPQIKIEGVGRDNIAVALFMKNLESSRFIQSVDLISTRQINQFGTKVYEFTLSCAKKRS
jgi:type IV pilus assembly protein PilN